MTVVKIDKLIYDILIYELNMLYYCNHSNPSSHSKQQLVTVGSNVS